MFSSGINSFLNWSKRVGSLFGIPIYIHITILFFLWPVLSGTGLGVGLGLEYVALIVLSILLHELGHALAAKHYKLTGLSITLHGFGGFAMSSGARTPTQSLVITICGPAVTFAIAIVCLLVGNMGAQGAEIGSGAFIQFRLIHAVGTLNLIMGIVNMVPLLPFDGGNAMSAILAHRMSEFKAMRLTAHFGLLLAVPLTIYMLIIRENFLVMFGLIGAVTCYSILANSGGIRFGEAFADRRARREIAAVKKREQARSAAYLDEVDARTREREEKERLRKLLGD